MAATSANNSRRCIYCGTPTKRVRKGEHIVPQAIGGALTIKEVSGRVVCHDCNNGVLSELDRELCSRSFLSIVASQEIGAHMWQAWEVDHASRNLLVEAKPFWESGELRSLVCYPQMTFEAGGPELRGDAEEMERFGRDDFQRVLVRAIRRAFQRYNAREKKALHLESIQSDITSHGYRLAPRVFTPHSISEIARNIKKQSFILRYEAVKDRQLALRWLSRLDDTQRFNRWTNYMGAPRPTICHFFDIGRTMRALMKLGVNLLAAYCERTPIDSKSLSEVIRLIRGDRPPDPRLLAANGFVNANDIEDLKAANRSHSFRLVYLGGEWVIYSSFFGGRLGAVVAFPGPNYEDWGTMNVIAPLNSKEWRLNRSGLVQPIKVRVEWSDVVKITPSVKSLNDVSTILVQSVSCNRL